MNTEMMDREEERRWFKRGTKGWNALFGCWVDGKVAGAATFTFTMKRERMWQNIANSFEKATVTWNSELA
jgi:hypothetical protein